MVCISSVDTINYYSQAACSFLSIVGCIYILSAYNTEAKLRVYSFRIICYYSISIITYSIQFLFPKQVLSDFPTVCKIFAYLNNCSGVISFIWVTCMALTIYLVIVKSLLNYQKYEKYWILITIITAVLFTIPFFTGGYGLVHTNCTFTADKKGNLWRILLFYTPSWIMTLITIFCYVRIFKELKSLRINLQLKNMIKKLVYYPIWMVINIVLLSVMSLAYYYPELCALQYMYIVIYCLLAMNGVINVLIFKFTASIRPFADQYSSMTSSVFRERSKGESSLFELESPI